MGSCPPTRPPRAVALLLALGGALAAAGAAFHPPTLDPGDPAALLRAVAANPRRWVAVHMAFGAGVGLWTLGLLELARWAGRRLQGWAAPGGAACLVAALALWLPAFTFEAAGLPVIAAGQVEAWLRAAWPSVLALGYVAAQLQWAGGLLLALDLTRLPGWARLLGRAGLVLLPPGMAGMVAAWLWPGVAVPLLLLTAVPGALWSLALGALPWDRA